MPSERKAHKQYEDGDFITREDAQFDLLYALFTDEHHAFTDPNPDPDVPLAQTPLCTFAELYVNGILNSPKCSTTVRQAMLADPLFAVEYSKLAFLVNIGRFNTRVSFDPHIRSTHKIYLSVPSLMTSPFSMSHLQDVSRMKSTLRSCLLNDEKNCPAATPTEVLHKVSVGIKPPTTVANLIFVLFTHAQVMSKLHFTSDNDFLDMFSAKDTPVMTRARAFLWLLFYYLEGPDRPNPWADAHTLVSPGKAPLLVRAEGAPLLQNVDSRKENQVGQTMREKRRHFLQTVHQEMSTEPMAQEPAPRPSEAIHLTHSANPSAPIPQTMLHHAWNLVHSLEPLQDSDEEYDKRDVQVDLERRLQVLQSVGLGSS